MYLGLDIGRQYIKMVAVDKTRDGYKILDAGSRLVPEPNSAFDPEKVDRPHWVMAVKELFRQQDLNPRKIKTVISGINGSSASVKQITTLDMPTDELESAMTFEARKHIPMDGTDAVIDYQIIGSNSKEVDKIDVCLVACTKGVIKTHLELLKECGLKPGVVDMNPIAISNGFNFIKDMPDDGLAVVIDIGSVSSSLIVFGNNQEFFTRDLPIGGHDFVKEVSDKKNISYTEAQDLLYREGLSVLKEEEIIGDNENVQVSERTSYDNLIEDVRRSLRFYAKQTGQSFFLKIFLSGGSGSTPGLKEFVNEKLNIETDLFNPFENLTLDDSISISNVSQYAVALGLAIRGGLSDG
ncbi:MAG: hypothetical protein CMG62_11125 [Candidatus Marinimicrobia bacterium]|nr:hypothetical protein [Candidatus Neomarinimicrobiota bacterium]|tara:strand:- start:1816 stop:2874 length:1059 start_codon:yes stop_codon:yes gene_type:complete